MPLFRNYEFEAEIFDSLAEAIVAGIPLSQAMQELSEDYRKSAYGRELAAWSYNIESGRDLVDSIRDHPILNDPQIKAFLWLGQKTGAMASAFRSVAQRLRYSGDLAKKLASDLTYPAIVVVGLGCLFFFLNNMVFPHFQAVYNSFNSPLPTWILFILKMNAFILDRWVVIVAVATILAAWAFFIRKHRIVEQLFDWFVLSMPFTGSLIRMRELFTFSHLMGEILKQDGTVQDGTHVMAETVKPGPFRKVWKTVDEKVNQGLRLDHVLANYHWHFPLLFVYVLNLGIDNDDLVQTFEDLAEHYKTEYEMTTERFTSMFAVFLVLAVGSGLMGLALAFWKLQFGLVDLLG